jgi:UDP-2,3-diacylglucosamine hydrolase
MAAGPLLAVAPGEVALFASDVHLQAGDPATAERFLDRIERAGAGAAHAGRRPAHLFLLGDLFDVWIGDDADNPRADDLASVLVRLAEGGTRIWLMRGNRDFLMDVPVPRQIPDPAAGSPGDRAPAGLPFSQRCHAAMLPDPAPILLHGIPAILTHGDALCTDDIAYQRWRATCRAPAWQQAFLARSIDERMEVVRQVRAIGEIDKRQMTESLMDVNEDAVEALMREHDVPLLIHGHTHRPARHESDGRVRWVLPDWDAEAGRGEMLCALDGQLAMLD